MSPVVDKFSQKFDVDDNCSFSPLSHFQCMSMRIAASPHFHFHTFDFTLSFSHFHIFTLSLSMYVDEDCSLSPAGNRTWLCPAGDHSERPGEVKVKVKNKDTCNNIWFSKLFVHICEESDSWGELSDHRRRPLQHVSCRCSPHHTPLGHHHNWWVSIPIISHVSHMKKS